MHLSMVPRSHQLRPAAERLIADVYAQCYFAQVDAFPELLVAVSGGDGSPVCAAALRFADEGFFSECYLDAPIQTLLGGEAKAASRRDRIFEVTSLASRTPLITGSFLRAIIAEGHGNGFEWAFFTATERLKNLLTRLRLPLVPLGRAERARVADPHAWGSYYENGPRVYAVHRAGAAYCLDGPAGTER